METLTDQEIEAELAGLPGWEFDGEVITRTYELASFREAIDLVNDIADLAEENNHHPDLEIYYDEVVVSLRTHSEDAITSSDVAMANEVERLVEEGGYDVFDADFDEDFDDEDFDDDLDEDDDFDDEDFDEVDD